MCPNLGLTPHLLQLITTDFNEAVGGITEEYLGIRYLNPIIIVHVIKNNTPNRSTAHLPGLAYPTAKAKGEAKEPSQGKARVGGQGT